MLDCVKTNKKEIANITTGLILSCVTTAESSVLSQPKRSKEAWG